MKQRLRKETGITLVALVVTIVVLLILAGITIMYTMGDNSIFKKAQEAKNKTEEAIQNEQEYMNSIDNMINEYTNGTSTPTPEVPENPWAKIDRIAKAIANDSNITSDSTKATGTTEKGESYDIKIGDILEVEYNGEIRRVRILGFKHDDLVDTTVYGGNHTKASISFEFLDFMTGDNYMSMNSSNTNEGGWADTEIRTFLNGTNGKDKLSNKAYIKQAKKKYIATYNDANSVTTCNDYLWMLAASEIVPQNSDSTRYGYAITSEGKQYKYYQGIMEIWTTSSEDRIKYNGAGNVSWWWLRSTGYHTEGGFGNVSSDGYIYNGDRASVTSGVAPGFCI